MSHGDPSMEAAVGGGSEDSAQDLDILLQRVEALQTQAATGQLVDLTGLDTETERLLQSLATIPPDRQKAAAAGLRRLIEAVGVLEQTLRNAQEADRSDGLFLGEDTARPVPAGRAAAAYQRGRTGR